MPTALVTGAAGFIGSHLVDSLLQRGYRVRGLDNLSTGSRENLQEATEHDQFSLFEGDVRDRETVSAALDGVDSVFHLAAYTSVPGSFERPAHVSAINCTGTATVFEVALDAGVDSVVFASSAAVYGSDTPTPVDETVPTAPESPYASSKVYGEQIGQQFAEAYGLSVVSLRFFNVYGPRQDPDGEYAAVIPAFIDRLVDGQQPVIFGDGGQTRDFIFVSDLVEALVSAERAAVSGVYNAATGNRCSILELAEALSDILDVPCDPCFEAERPGDIRHSVGDCALAENDLDFEAAVSLREGLTETVEYFQTYE